MVVDLSNLSVTRMENVTSFRLPEDDGGWMAYLLEADDGGDDDEASSEESATEEEEEDEADDLETALGDAFTVAFAFGGIELHLAGYPQVVIA